MRIAVIGSGGVGGAFGAALAQAGADVTFVARGAHLEAMRANGLRVASPRGDMHIHPCKVTANPAEIGVVDVVGRRNKEHDIRPTDEVDSCPQEALLLMQVETEPLEISA